MPQPSPEYNPSSPTEPLARSGNRKWGFVTKWIVIQGVVNLLIFWALPEGVLFPVDVSRYYDARSFRSINARGRELSTPYRLMRPGQSGGQYPLVVFLHGSGERGSDNLSQLRFLPEQMATARSRKRYPCFLLAPQCGENSAWTLEDKQAAVIALVEQTLKDEPTIDRGRIYLTGVSMGGSGVWQLAVRRPDLFTAVVPVCGAGDPEQAKALVSVPIWAVHGTADEVIPASQSREMISAINSQGGHPKFSELIGVGHDSWKSAYEESNGIIDWMFLQSRTLNTVESPQSAR